MDAETLAPLLCGEHIGVTDRIARGRWPHPPTGFEVLTYLTRLLEDRWNLHLPGDLDGGRVIG